MHLKVWDPLLDMINQEIFQQTCYKIKDSKKYFRGREKSWEGRMKIRWGGRGLLWWIRCHPRWTRCLPRWTRCHLRWTRCLVIIICQISSEDLLQWVLQPILKTVVQDSESVKVQKLIKNDYKEKLIRENWMLKSSREKLWISKSLE
jgi:hypothetical protein